MINIKMNQVLELKTTIEVEKSMKLLDINGKKINFQSDCIIKSDPKTPFQIAIVNQTDLDEGTVNFETCTGNFSRRVKYESSENEHINHYIAFKKFPNTGENSIKAEVIVQLTELQSPPKITMLNEQVQRNEQFIDSEPKMSLLNVPESDSTEVELLKNKLYELSQSNEYNTQTSFYRNIAIGCFLMLILFVILKK